MHREDAGKFDKDWNKMAGKYGLKGSNKGQLGYGDSHASSFGGGIDNGRRGHFLPMEARG